MEAEKRKQAGNDVVSRRQKHKKAPEVTEDEVEEFFAIIRNIQAAFSYFKSADGGGSKFLDGGGLRALLESNEEAEGLNGKDKTEKKENSDFDLNAEPEPEPEREFDPC